MNPFQEGAVAKTICDNPYWKEYPKTSSLGPENEKAARAFVDGWVSRYTYYNCVDKQMVLELDIEQMKYTLMLMEPNKTYEGNMQVEDVKELVRVMQQEHRQLQLKIDEIVEKEKNK